MKAYQHTQVMCPECNKKRSLVSVMKWIVMPDGKMIVTCVHPLCDLFHVPFEAPTVKIKPAEGITSEDVGRYLEELRKASG